MRLMQHKREAYWFYRYLSIFYDKLVNPLFWTEAMRDQALTLGDLDTFDIDVIDVGSGTGFTTQGIVQYVPPHRVTCVDQSPHQMARAKEKEELQGCTFQLGDAENIPYATDHFDRYVSAGSIEYWPDPQQGIAEAYRVIKPGGKALMIGPLEPESAFSRWIANTWMLFPKEEEYLDWYRRAGFTDIRRLYVRPHWVRHDAYGIAVVGTKPRAGVSPADNQLDEIDAHIAASERTFSIGRLIIGSLAGFLFIPMALFGYLRASLFPPRKGDTHELNSEQWTALIVVVVVILLLFLLLLL